MIEYLLPKRIIESKDVTNEQSLFVKKGMYAIHFSNYDLMAHYARMEHKGSYIILDFGQEMCGGIRLFSGAIYCGIAKARIRFGESLGEVNSSIGEHNATNDHAPRDFETFITTSADLLIGNTGFRYVRIDLLEEKQVYLRNIFCVNHIFKAPQIYDYKGNDALVKQIFDVAKRTIDLCSSSGYIWDGVKRDRLIWIGDCAPEIMSLMTLYGDVEPIRNSLDAAEESFVIPNYINGISTYSMWWIIILNDYYQAYKDFDYLSSKKTYLLGLQDMFDKLIDDKGNLDQKVRHLVDWPTVGTVDEEVGIRMIFLYAMNNLIDIFKTLSINTKKAQEIKDRILIRPIDVKEKKQVVALKYFATGKISDEEYQILIKDRAYGFSTFMSYYILTAIASRDKKLAIELMKEYYGTMLDKGATSFWEDFNLEWCKDSGRIDEINPHKKDIHGDYGAYCYVGYRHSLCHGWSTGVIKFIKENC